MSPTKILGGVLVAATGVAAFVWWQRKNRRVGDQAFAVQSGGSLPLINCLPGMVKVRGACVPEHVACPQGYRYASGYEDCLPLNHPIWATAPAQVQVAPLTKAYPLPLATGGASRITGRPS